MAEEIQEAIQIVRVGYDGIEIAMKICGGTLEQIKKAVDFMIAVMDHEKTMGKTDMRKLLMKGGDLQVLQFPTDEIKKVEKMAKKYGLLYSVLPDINKNDGMSEIIFHTEAVPRVNMMLQKLKAGKIATFDDYLKNGDEKEIDKVLSFLKEQKRGNDNLHTEEAVKASETLTKLMEKVGNYAMEKKSISVEEVKENFSLEKEQAEKIVGQLERIGVISKEENGKHKVQMDKDMFINRMRGYQKLANRIQAVTTAKNPDLIDITIAKQLITEENNHAIKTRIPNTWGENAQYIWINKEKAMDINGGKTILTFLDINKDYKIYSKDNKVIDTIKAKDLYDKHYDKVSAKVSKRYEDVEKKTKEHIQKKKPKAPASKKR